MLPPPSSLVTPIHPSDPSLGFIFSRNLLACQVDSVYMTLCNPMDCSTPGFSVYGILQARILEWVTPGDLPDSGIEPVSPAMPALQVDSSLLSHWRSPEILFSSVQFNHSNSTQCPALCDPMMQHTKLPCPSPTPRVYSNSCPLSWWCHPIISS